jgi:two-component system, NtrC family, response regulator AtoC
MGSSVLPQVAYTAFPIRVMVLDDDALVGKAVQRSLRTDRFEVELACDVAPVLARLREGRGDWDVVLLDVQLSGSISGIEMIPYFRRSSAMTSVVMMSGIDRADTATTCLRAGAYHYITKPFRSAALNEVVFQAATHASMQRAINGLRTSAEGAQQLANALVGHSALIRNTRNQILQLATQSLTTPILIHGETGTGKELVARALHDQSERSLRPFVPLNCGALPENLIESELFGHARGSFTGAYADRPGLFVEADGGTLFLDEIGDMPLILQVKLLRVLQEREVRPVGSTSVRAVDVRIVAATHVDLHSAVAEKRFREDLLYRLRVIELTIPPLRERIEDVPDLAAHFLRKHVPPAVDPPQLDRLALEVLMGFHWPGNVRQLENVILHALALRTGDIIYPEALPPWVSMPPRGVPGRLASDDLEPMSEAMRRVLGGDDFGGGLDLKAWPGLDLPEQKLPHMTAAKRNAISAFEQEYLRRVMKRANGTVTEAARIAGLDRANFRRLLRANGIDANDFRIAKYPSVAAGKVVCLDCLAPYSTELVTCPNCEQLSQ